jgi:hypothetical protein
MKQTKYVKQTKQSVVGKMGKNLFHLIDQIRNKHIDYEYFI